MPNLPAQIGEGLLGWISHGLSAVEKKMTQRLLSLFGTAIQVKKEDMINAVTAVSSSATAYVFAVLESLERAAVSHGFGKKEARTLALQTLIGSSKYAALQKEDFGVLKGMVQTKGGTTEAAFKILKKKKWQWILEKAMTAAYEKALEMGHR